MTNWPRPSKRRRSIYGYISGLRLDRAAPGEAWSSLPYRPVFVGDTETGVLHGGVVTAMLDESCGMAVQLALDGTRAIATLDLRIDYQKPATPGLDIKAHSFCYRVTRSIAFVRSTAYQESEDDPVATATACFMIGANRTNMLTGPADGRSARRRRSKRRRIRPAHSPTAPSRAVSASASARMARWSIVKQGRRVVAFEAQAWQDDRARPIASAFGHFMLRQTPGAAEE